MNSTPEFTAIYNDPDAGDLATHYRIQVSTSSSFTTAYWDSDTSTMATTTEGNRSPELSYAGSALSQNTAYYWRIKFSDDGGTTGEWSTATSTFILSPAIQNISFTYDANGNILTIADSAVTDASRSVVYTYDALNRLVAASSTAASTTPYRHQFAYTMLGNISGMSTTLPPRPTPMPKLITQIHMRRPRLEG